MMRARRLASTAACNQATDGKHFSVPVLIVGAGPVGLVLSILLSKLGIKSLVLEKRSSFLQHPQAHFINNRTMEIFRRIGSLSADIEKLQPPVALWRKFLYCTSLTGHLLGEVDHLHPQDLSRSHSPTWVAHFSQHRLLPLLQLQAERLGMRISTDPDFCANGVSDIKLGYECMSLEEHINGVKASVSRSASKLKNIWTINCSFLVGADGASSRVRKLLDIKMKGQEAMQNLVSIHFFSTELAAYLSKERPGMLYFVFNPKAIGVIVAHDLRLGEFVVQVPFYPPQQRIEEFTDDVCRTIICDLAGINKLDVHIKAVRQWAMHAQVAESYFSRNQRIILAGDAAHRFPPAGGFGMNTGIQDAHNLAWKIGAVIKGLASCKLLRTYELERKPVAEANTSLSLENFKAAASIPSILGLNPSNARFVHDHVSKGIGSLLPHWVQRNMLEGIFALGRLQVAPFMLSLYNPFGTRRLQKLKDMLKKGKSLQLQFPAEDLGFRYQVGALVANEDIKPIKEECYVPSRRNEYKPVCLPGARIPHMNLTILGSDFSIVNKAVISTLDLLKGDAVQFLAFVGPNQSGSLWAKSFLDAASAFGVNVKVVMVWPVDFGKSVSNSLINGLSGFSADKRSSEATFPTWMGCALENVLHVQEVDKDWWELCKISSLGTILVRPDDHVAWVSCNESSDNSKHDIQNIFAVLLGRDVT